MPSLEDKAVRLAQAYRAGEVDDDVLDAMAKQWVGVDADTIRRMAGDVPPKVEEVGRDV